MVPRTRWEGRVHANPPIETPKQDRTETSDLPQLLPSKPGAGERAEGILGFTGGVHGNYSALLL